MTTTTTTLPANGGQTIWPKFATALSRRLSPLESSALCGAARRHLSLQDFGDPPLEPALSALVSSLEDEAKLHPLGRFLMRTHLLSLLETRLRLAEAWKTDAGAVQSRAVEKPLAVAALPQLTRGGDVLAPDRSPLNQVRGRVGRPRPAHS